MFYFECFSCFLRMKTLRGSSLIAEIIFLVNMEIMIINQD